MFDVDRTISVPHPAGLTIAELDEILTQTGVDPQDPAMSPGKVLAALVCWQLNAQNDDGVPVSYDDVYKHMRVGNVRYEAAPPDPTQPGASAAAPRSSRRSPTRTSAPRRTSKR